jgi:hypothetical protein
MGWGLGFQSFVASFWFSFYQVWLQKGSILFGLLKVYQACLELVASGLVDSGLVGLQGSR